MDHIDEIKSMYKQIGDNFKMPTAADCVFFIHEELSELTRVLMTCRRVGDRDYLRAHPLDPSAAKADMEKEFGDLLRMVYTLGSELGVDADECFRRSVNRMVERAQERAMDEWFRSKKRVFPGYDDDEKPGAIATTDLGGVLMERPQEPMVEMYLSDEQAERFLNALEGYECNGPVTLRKGSSVGEQVSVICRKGTDPEKLLRDLEEKLESMGEYDEGECGPEFPSSKVQEG